MHRAAHFIVVSFLVLGGLADAAGAPAESEDSYYRTLPLPLPTGEMVEPGGLEWMPDGRLAVATRTGDIWMVEGAFDDPPEKAEFKLYAGGLHEVLGLARQGDSLYATQRCEVTRIKDLDGDGRADLFETVSDGWEITGDYHEYAFGSKFDREGNLWVVLCLTGSFNSNALFRGWCLRITPDGRTIPTCSGIRSPGGIGLNADGDMFYTDNQGPWNGTCGLKHLKPGYFMGHPAGNRWYSEAKNMGPAPQSPQSGSRFHVEAKKIPRYLPAAVLFPYQKMGQSASGILCDGSGGKFGPFENQLFVGDQTHSTLMRVFLEKVKGRYQGVCFPFRKGFGSGALSLAQAADGSVFVGTTARGWGSRGGKPFSLERLVWTGEVPFEIHEMRARPNGFELTFTKPVNADACSRVDAYKMSTYTYIFQSSYGSPEVDHTQVKIESATVTAGGRSVRLVVDKLAEGHIHELHLPGVRSGDGKPLLHAVAYYTLNQIPDKNPIPEK